MAAPEAGDGYKLSLLSNSAPLTRAFLDWSQPAGLSVVRVVEAGDDPYVDEGKLLVEAAEGRDFDCLVCLLDGLSAGESFLRRAEALSSSVPVLALASGLDVQGSTGAPAAAFERAGVMLVRSFEWACDLTWAMSRMPCPGGDRSALATIENGWHNLAQAILGRHGIKLMLSEPQVAQLPLAEQVEKLLTQPDLDQVVVLLAPQADDGLREQTEQLIASLGTQPRLERPLALVVVGGEKASRARLGLNEAGLCVFPTLERATRALSAMAFREAWLKRPPRVVTRFPVNRHRAERVIKRHQRQLLSSLEEYQARQVLAAYGFAVPEGKLVTSVDEALDAAQRLGYPVALKLVCSDILDKGAVGGIRRNLSGAAAVRDAFDLIVLRMRERNSTAQVEGVYVEQQRGVGIQTTIGFRHDAEFGAMLSFGLGGTSAELLSEQSFHPAPITAQEALELLSSSQVFSHLSGGQRPGMIDMNAIAVGLQRLSQLATDYPQVDHLEIRPFWVGGPGQEPLAEGVSMSLALGEES